MSGESDAGYLPDGPSYAIFFLLKQGGDPAGWVRLWSGDGLHRLGADAIDTTGGDYIGLGFPANVPALTQCINGAFDNLDFVLSGVDQTAIDLSTVNRDQVFRSPIHVGLCDFDAAAQPIGTPDWLWEAKAGKPRIKRSGQGDTAVRAIVLPSSTAMVDRNVAAYAYWTPADQKARFPTDQGCDYTPSYAEDTTYAWPAAGT